MENYPELYVNSDTGCPHLRIENGAINVDRILETGYGGDFDQLGLFSMKFSSIMPTDKIKIVVLDGYTLNPGDLNWGELKPLGTCEIYERSSPKEVIERAQGPQLSSPTKHPPRELITKLDALKYIGVTATG